MRKCPARTNRFLIALILLQFVPFAVARATDPQGTTEDLSAGATFTFEIGPNLPQFTFKVIPEKRRTDKYGSAQSTVHEIVVFRGKSKQPLQHLSSCDLNEMEVPFKGSSWLRTGDINFDGYQDINLVTTQGVTGNEGGCFWLFNPTTRRFDYSDAFSKLYGPRIDPTTKTLFCFATGGMAGMVHSASKYKVQNNRPVLIWSEEQDWDNSKNQSHCVQQELRSDKMTTILDMRGAEDGVRECDASRLFAN
jgi:hypothetical protein